MSAILTVSDLGIHFGENHVLKSVNFEVYENEVLGIMGPNGAGKTVLLNIISGILPPTKGTITFMGQDLKKKKITERTKMGIGRTFQVPRAFSHMTVYENILTSVVYGTNVKEKEAEKRAAEILELVRLTKYANERAEKLRLIGRKRLEIGAALGCNPKLLLLDEVAGGLTNMEVGEILDIVKTIKAQGVSIMWIEHVIQTLVEGTDRIMLMADGHDLAIGKPEEMIGSKLVNEVYMGADEDE